MLTFKTEFISETLIYPISSHALEFFQDKTLYILIE